MNNKEDKITIIRDDNKLVTIPVNVLANSNYARLKAIITNYIPQLGFVFDATSCIGSYHHQICGYLNVFDKFIPFKTMLSVGDSFIYILIGMIEYVNAENAKRHVGEKKIAGASKFIFGVEQVVLSSILMGLTLSGVLTGAAAIAVPVAFGLALAAPITAADVRIFYKAYKANKKANMEYLTHDRLYKYENIRKKIEAINKQIEIETNNKNKEKLEAKKASFEASKEILKNQAIALAKVEYANDRLFSKNMKIDNKTIVSYIRDEFKIDVTNKDKNTPSKQEKIVAAHLKEKQHQKFEFYMNIGIAVSVVTVGIVLLAFAPLSMAVAAVGTAFFGAGTIALTGIVGGLMISNNIAKMNAVSVEKNKIITDFAKSEGLKQDQTIDDFLKEQKIPNVKIAKESGKKTKLTQQQRIELYYAFKNSDCDNAEAYFAAMSNTQRGSVNKVIKNTMKQKAMGNIIRREMELNENDDIDQLISKKDQATTFMQYATKHHGLIKSTARFFKENQPKLPDFEIAQPCPVAA